MELPATRHHRAKSSRGQRLERIRGEFFYSELAVRCDDLGVNGGHPAVQSWKLMGIMGDHCSVLSWCYSCIRLCTFNTYHGTQLETGYWAMWVLINLFSGVLASLLYMSNPS